MATEYKLSYTGSEVNERLQRVDDIKAVIDNVNRITLRCSEIGMT